MGQHADDALDRAAQDCDDLLDYQLGDMTDEEACDRGILDEHGYMPDHTPQFGVHDAGSLLSELDRLELRFRRRRQ